MGNRKTILKMRKLKLTNAYIEAYDDVWKEKKNFRKVST